MNYKYLTTTWEQLKGLMFVKDIPRDLIVVFPFFKPKYTMIDTWFCRFNLDIGLLNEKNIIGNIYHDIKPFSIIFSYCNGFVESKSNTHLLYLNMEMGGDKYA